MSLASVYKSFCVSCGKPSFEAIKYCNSICENDYLQEKREHENMIDNKLTIIFDKLVSIENTLELLKTKILD